MYHHVSNDLDARLGRIETLLTQIAIKEAEMAGELQSLQDQVAQTQGVEQSALTLIQGLHQQLLDAIAAGNPAALTSLASNLKTSADALAAAVAANPTP